MPAFGCFFWVGFVGVVTSRISWILCGIVLLLVAFRIGIFVACLV